MTTAIVILNWNGVKYLQQFLPILIEHTPKTEVEIIVADNASTDSSLQAMKDYFPSIRTIVLDKNYGFAGGYNKALEQVEADYYVLLNSDVEVTDNWLLPLLNYMNENESVAACQPKIRSYFNKKAFEHAGASGGFIDQYGFPFCRGRVFGVVEEDRGQYDDITDIFWATGACLVVRSKIFWKVGRLDSEFFAHMEEIDLCWRLKSRGYRVVCVPESIVYHIGGGTLHVDSPHKIYLNFRNNLLLLYKNLPTDLLKRIMFWRFFFDYSAAFQFIAMGKFQNAKSVFSARRDYKKMLPDFFEKRNENILYSTNLNIAEIFPESIVLKYFLQNRKTYNSLKNR